jgi:asparagine N-glycosylation enzyme membrane subunit Stt3
MTYQPSDEPQLPDEDGARGRQPAASSSSQPAWEAQRPLILAVLGVLLLAIGVLLNRTHGTVHLIATIIGVLLLGGAAAFVLAHPAMRSRRR